MKKKKIAKKLNRRRPKTQNHDFVTIAIQIGFRMAISMEWYIMIFDLELLCFFDFDFLFWCFIYTF